MTCWIRRLCSVSCSFTSHFQICDATNMRWVAIEIPHMSLKICPYFTATQRVSVGSQICKRDVIAQLKLHNLQIDHVTIRSELKYLIVAKAVGTVKLEPLPGSNQAKIPQFNVRSGKQPRQENASRIVRRVWNRPVPIFRSKPWPLVGYPDPLLTLGDGNYSTRSTYTSRLVMSMSASKLLQISNLLFAAASTNSDFPFIKTFTSNTPFIITSHFLEYRSLMLTIPWKALLNRCSDRISTRLSGTFSTRLPGTSGLSSRKAVLGLIVQLESWTQHAVNTDVGFSPATRTLYLHQFISSPVQICYERPFKIHDAVVYWRSAMSSSWIHIYIVWHMVTLYFSNFTYQEVITKISQ